ncbi:1-propanol dehydrogenase PduQ [Anaerococcus sp. AGMB09787]|uniref:1-propanol dehydrogenase PduQ n=1 Tax=Anaerococcus sp. AGMB09787 TaxID=2922869 RepID=UPI001FAEDB84|nr:1-propanol dehydrogenase PduQ [Anaerococcus sp. AGMB09787]
MEIFDKTRVIFGKDSLKNLNEIKNKDILVITDEFLYKNKITDLVTNNLKDNNITFFYEINPDPSLSVVSKALSKLLRKNCEYIVAVGGGSVIDTAKGVLYFGKSLFKKKHIFIAIPTTSGTGSEVTSIAVIKDEDTNIKHLCQSDEILPDVAILDVNLTKNLPQSIIANTGIDVLTHSIEAYVSTQSNYYSDALCEKAGELIVKNLLLSYDDKENIKAKENMHIASMLAGLAFQNAGLGLNHSIAHQIGGFLHIPHGLANGILINKIIDYNCKCAKAKEKYSIYAKKIGISDENDNKEKSIIKLKYFVDILQNKMNMPKNISELKVELNSYNRLIEEMANSALLDNCISTNPVNVLISDVIKILESIY